MLWSQSLWEPCLWGYNLWPEGGGFSHLMLSFFFFFKFYTNAVSHQSSFTALDGSCFSHMA